MRMKALFVYVFLGFVASVVHGAEKEFAAAESCSADEYLDITNYQCYKCSLPPNAPVGGDTGAQAKEGNPADPYTCQCKSGWTTYEADSTTSEPCNNPFALSNFWCDSFRCVSCPQSSSLDGTTCMTCSGNGISFDSKTKKCQCSNPNHVLRETDSFGELLSSKNKICEPCPGNTVLRARYLEALRQDQSISSTVPETTEEDYYKCESCPHPAMTISSSGRCVCSLPGQSNPKWTEVGVEGYKEGTTCVLTSETAFANSNDYAEVKYTHVEIPYVEDSDEAFEESRESGRSLQQAADGFQSYTVKKSIVFEQYFIQAAVKCRYLRTASDMQSCHTLANLCVLQFYDKDTPACELYEEIQSKRDAWTDVSWDWRLLTPWLYYQDSATTITKDLGIQMSMSFDMTKKSGTFDRMRFVLAKYALNGEFKGWEEVSTQFEFCTPTQNVVPEWLRFGYGSSISYTCNLLQVVDHFPEPEFYDMYLIDFAESELGEEAKVTDGKLEGASLFPVPVKVRNLVSNGQFPNENELLTQQSDDVFTRRFFLYDQVSSRETVGGKPQVIRYAKDIKLTTFVREDSPENIYPPVLEILYHERLVSDIESEGNDENGSPKAEASTSTLYFNVEYTEDYSGFWSSATALFIFAMTLFVLLLLMRLYNWNRRNTRLAGDGSIDCSFLVRGVALFFATFASVMFWFLFLYAEYFFVFFKLQDNIHLLLPVERPEYGKDNDYYPFELLLKLCFVGQIFRMGEILWRQTSCDIFFLDWEKPRGKVASKKGDGTRAKYAPVSVWRTIFMANEWNEIQTCRKYNIELSLFILGTVLVASDYQYLATLTPNYKNLTEGELNVLLRFANTTFWFLVIAYGQIIWNWAIQNRYFSEPPTHSFVDLCTMAKVSVFILDEDYHGYYLHCRSQHEFADGSMLEISRQLRQEEEGLTTDRGLPGTESGLQTFEIYVSGEWKRQYDYIFRSMVSQEISNSQADTSGFILRVLRRRGGKPAAEKLVKASRKLNAFLRSFIDQTTSEFPMEHRDQTFMHRFLHLPPEMMSTKATIFYPDNQYSFESVLFYGETWNLILFNVLCIAIFDFWWDNTMLSLFLTYGADLILVFLRQSFGNTNLASKTLVDDRFLI